MRPSPRVISRIASMLLLAVLIACGGNDDDAPSHVQRVEDPEWSRAVDHGQLRVLVADAASGEPLPRAVVILSDARQWIEKRVSNTDARGVAEFRVLPPGIGYAILVTEPGYEAVGRKGIWVMPSQTRVVTLSLVSEIGADETVVDHRAVASPKGELRVRVVDAVDGSPLPGARAVMTRARAGDPSCDSVANVDGLVFCRDLPPDAHYVVHVTMPGYVTARRNEIRVEPGRIRTLVIALAEEIIDGLYPATRAAGPGSDHTADALDRGSRP